MRLFIALELPDVALRHLERLTDALRPVAPGASFARPGNLHLTLKFLGESPDESVPGLCTALESISAGELMLRANETLCFPPRGSIRIIGASVESTSGDILALQSDIESACHGLGYPRENRAFRPHVTLARACRPLPQALRARLQTAAEPLLSGPAFTVSEFALIQSVLDSRGAQYTPLARFGLAE